MISVRPSPSMSANAGELAPSAFRYFGKAPMRSGSLWEKYWRCSMAVFHGVVVSPSAWTTTRTRKASFSGRSRDVGSSAGVYAGGARSMAARTWSRFRVASTTFFALVPLPAVTVVHFSSNGKRAGWTPGANCTS